MKYLIISTLPEDDKLAKATIDEFSSLSNEVEVLHTENMNISHCVGCNHCWLKTPGICPIKDDYEQIFIKYLEVDRIIFITETKLGFVSYKMKNLLDRILPLATMYLKGYKGQIRHVIRYKKTISMGCIYIGDADKDYLNEWMDRTVLNFYGESLGVYEISEKKEFYNALSNN